MPRAGTESGASDCPGPAGRPTSGHALLMISCHNVLPNHARVIKSQETISTIYSDFSRFPLMPLFLFHDPIQDPTLYLVVTKVSDA